MTTDLLEAHVKKILVPRVSGSQGNIEVRQYIIDVLNKNDYHIELDEFSQDTPVGNIKFANIIASRTPKACRQLVLACHYDSKMMNGFLGAIDSAVPCAMLLRIAETFEGFKNSTISGKVGLTLIFFDGEEAFVQWSHSDSLYGSRHLAAKWAKQPAPDECKQSQTLPKSTKLDRVELFVLLDLIGTTDTTFVQYSFAVKRHYHELQKYESEHIFKSNPGMSRLQIKHESSFRDHFMSIDHVEDDHVPFKERGVQILLLLAHPFPRVWHTVADNYDAIDFEKTRRILYAIEQFVAYYS